MFDQSIFDEEGNNVGPLLIYDPTTNTHKQNEKAWAALKDDETINKANTGYNTIKE
jgi:hypothetical protein